LARRSGSYKFEKRQKELKKQKKKREKLERRHRKPEGVEDEAVEPGETSTEDEADADTSAPVDP
jgi:hypothetical protein